MDGKGADMIEGHHLAVAPVEPAITAARPASKRFALRAFVHTVSGAVAVSIPLNVPLWGRRMLVPSMKNLCEGIDVEQQ
jgi:hypothetical protein